MIITTIITFISYCEWFVDVICLGLRVEMLCGVENVPVLSLMVPSPGRRH